MLASADHMMQLQNQRKTLREQVKKIVNNIALLFEYVMGMHKATSISQWFWSIRASQMLEQYDTIWDSQHFREDDWPAKTATASCLQGSPKAKMHQGLTEKVTGLRGDGFGKEL